MEIRNKTLYDKTLIVKYNQFYLTSYIRRNFIVITAISLIFIVYMMIMQEWLYAGLLFGILIFYLGMTYLMQKLTTQRILKKSPLVEQPVMQTYLFRDQDFDVFNVKTYTVSYDHIAKVKIAKEFYLLQSRDRKTFIVSFAGFDSETERIAFEAFLIQRFGLKRPKK